MNRNPVAVSLDEVGRLTSTSKSQMYHYFASKDDLVAAVVTCVRDRILAFHGDLLIAVDSLEGLMESTGGRKFGGVKILRVVMFESDGWRFAPVGGFQDSKEAQ